MPVSELKMNAFERILFWAAAGLAILIVTLRLGFIAAVWYLHHIR